MQLRPPPPSPPVSPQTSPKAPPSSPASLGSKELVLWFNLTLADKVRMDPTPEEDAEASDDGVSPVEEKREENAFNVTSFSCLPIHLYLTHQIEPYTKGCFWPLLISYERLVPMVQSTISTQSFLTNFWVIIVKEEGWTGFS